MMQTLKPICPCCREPVRLHCNDSYDLDKELKKQHGKIIRHWNNRRKGKVSIQKLPQAMY